MIHGETVFFPWIRVLIRTTANGDEADRVREAQFELLMSQPRPIAMNFVNAKRRAVTGVAGMDGDELFPIGRPDAEDWQGAVGRAAEILGILESSVSFQPAVEGEIGPAHTPFEPGGRHLVQCLPDDAHEVCSQILRIALDVLRLICSQVFAEKKGQHPFEHRRTMRVGGMQGEALVCNGPAAGGKPFEHFGTDRCRDTAVIHTDNDRRLVVLPLQGESVGMEPLRNLGSLCGAAAVTAETHRIIRRDVDIRRTRLPRR